MKRGYSHRLRQTGTLNHVMLNAVNVMRMTGVELREHLADMIERNPFVEVERGYMDFGSGTESWKAPELPGNTRTSLYRHLADQFPLVFHSTQDMAIAVAFLQEIEPSGWLAVPVETISNANGFDLLECQSVFDRLRSLEPAGVFARSLKDCLRLQSVDRSLLDDVMEALITHLDQLISCDVATLARRLKTDPKELVRRLEQIRRMNPKPGSAFSFDETVLREADIVLHVTDQEMTFELSQWSFPSVSLSLASQGDVQGQSSHKATLNKLVQEAKALRTAVEMRKSTTLSVVAAIFARQREFLRHGYPSLIPMRMGDIADDIGVSEATVSRILSGLTVQCPQGCIAAKSLFCGPVSYRNQLRTKYVAIQMIKDLIAGEDKTSPFRDQDLACQLQNSGLEISRRMVAKYRQSLGLDAPTIRRKEAELAGLCFTPGEPRDAVRDTPPIRPAGLNHPMPRMAAGQSRQITG